MKKQNRDLAISLVLAALGRLLGLSVDLNFLLLLLACLVAIHGVYPDNGLRVQRNGRIFAAKVVGLTMLFGVIAFWEYVPSAQKSGVLVARAGHSSRRATLEIDDTGAKFSNPGTSNTPLMVLVQNQSLKLDMVDGRLQFTTKVEDKEGNILVQIDRNKWTVPGRPLDSDWNYTDDSLEVLAPTGRVVLQVRLFSDRVQLQGEWWNDNGIGLRLVRVSKGVGKFANLTRSHDPDEPHIELIFKYPNTENLGTLRDLLPNDVHDQAMLAAVVIYAICVFSCPATLLLIRLFD